MRAELGRKAGGRGQRAHVIIRLGVCKGSEAPPPHPFSSLLSTKSLRPEQPRSRIMILSLKKKKRVLTPPKYFHSLPPPQPTCLFAPSRLSRVQRRQSPDPRRGSLWLPPSYGHNFPTRRAYSGRLCAGPGSGVQGTRRRGLRVQGLLGRCLGGGVRLDILLLKEPSFFCLLP